MKWSAFGAAVESMEQLAATHPDSDVAADFLRFGAIVQQSIKFYLPEASMVLGERPYAQFADLFELPFDCISILSETFASETGERTGDSIAKPMLTLAFAVRGAFDLSIRWTPTAEQLPTDAWCYLVGLVQETLEGRDLWVPSGPVLFVCKQSDRIDIKPVPIAFNGSFYQQVSRAGDLGIDYGPERALREMQADVCALLNLCVMLGLKNVSAQEVPPPVLVNAKRAKKGKQPLWSYHVLEVDGERWDAPANRMSSSEREVRSHLRRGHVRRIGDGRLVWVRAAFVHGKAAGFVDKDYAVRGAASLH